MKVNCPSCRAALVFDVASGKLECKFCGSFFDLKDVADQEAKAENREAAKGEASDMAETMECDIYSCTSCGAELSVNGVEASTFCAYCGQPTIVFSRVSQELKPKWIIPFKVTKEEAVDKIRARFKKGLFIPRAVKNFELEKVHGIYMPYWLVDAYYYDSMLISGTIRTGKHKEVRYYSREADCEFKNLTLDASLRLNNESSQRLEPFDTEELKPFEVAYMSGYYADRFDESSKEIRYTAIKRVKEMFEGQMLATVKASRPRIESSDPKFELRGATYALLPAWFMTFRYKNKPYTMMVNGQTGKLVGAVPFHKAKAVSFLLGLFAVFASVLVPMGAMSAPWLLDDEDGMRILILLLAGVVALMRDGYRSLCRIKVGEELTSEEKMNQFAHERQEQQGGIYE